MENRGSVLLYVPNTKRWKIFSLKSMCISYILYKLLFSKRNGNLYCLFHSWLFQNIFWSKNMKRGNGFGMYDKMIKPGCDPVSHYLFFALVIAKGQQILSLLLSELLQWSFFKDLLEAEESSLI